MGIVGSILLKGKAIYRTHPSQQHPLGTRGYTRDGRVFRYTKNGGTALVVGNLIQAEAVPGNFSDDQLLQAGAAVSSGSSKAVLRMTSQASLGTSEDNYAEGYVFVNDGSGEGQMAQIKGQRIWTTASTNARVTTLSLMHGNIWTSAITTGSELGIIKNLYDDVIISPGTPTSTPVGVTPRAVATNQYFWLQTWGPAVCTINSLTTDVPAVGFPLVPSTVDGAMMRHFGLLTSKGSSTSWTTDVRVTLIAAARAVVGNCIEVGADGECGLIDLKIAP